MDGVTLKARGLVTKVVIGTRVMVTEYVQNPLYHPSPYAALTPPEVLHPRCIYER